jgi:DNA polymerase-4
VGHSERDSRPYSDEVGLTASAGISYNKFLAKLASDHRKPNGQFAVTPEMGQGFVETLPIGRFHGVGPVTAARMKRLGIETGADLRSKSMDFLQRHFRQLGGLVSRDRTRRGSPACQSGSGAQVLRLGDDLSARPDEPAEIEAGVLRMADDVWAWCEKAGLSAEP